VLVTDEIEADRAVLALGALAHENRLAVFRLLVQAGSDGMAAGAIAETVNLPNSSLSFHLAHLTRAGLIQQERRSRSLIYTADYAAMTALIGYLTENCCGGAPCMADTICGSEISTQRTNRNAP
jgi:ArsR family transcriptional regulator, arsenate/arsenite/antimonite-responsive transcriptional repressor